MDTYRLTPAVIRQMLADPDFYEECPSFAFLAKHGLATTAAWLRCLTSRGSPGYPGRDEERRLEEALAGLVATFMSHARNLATVDRESLRAVRHYLEACEMRDLGPICLEYSGNHEAVITEF